MIAMCFDLSSVCIGVTFAQIKNNQLVFVKTLAVIPQKPNAKALGYTTQEPKMIDSRGNRFQALLKPKETTISQEVAKKRISEYKSFAHRELLKSIGRQCGYYLEKVNPHLMGMEKNKSFNGILTTKLLAEIAGGLYFWSGAREVPLHDFDESTIRAYIRKTIPQFTRYAEGTNQMAIDTKWEIYCRLRSFFESHYPGLIDFDSMTMDESDSLAVFYYLYQTVIKKQEG